MRSLTWVRPGKTDGDCLRDLARTAEVYQGDLATQRDALKRASNWLVVFDAGVFVFDTCGMVVATGPERLDAVVQDGSNNACYREPVRSQNLRLSASVFSNVAADGSHGTEVICVSVPSTGEQGVRLEFWCEEEAIKVATYHEKLSRREFLKMAGLAASGVALAACKKGESAPSATPGKKTLVLAIQSFAHDAMRPVLDAWTEKTGLEVELEGDPETGEEMIAKYAPAFQAKTSPVDVLSNADDSGPTFNRAGWMESLDDVIPQETWDDFPKIFNSQIELFHNYEGKRYRVPHEFSIGYFWYRKDWFDRDGIQPPKTWEEFIDIGKAYTGDGISGTFDALTRPTRVFVYLAYITAQAGGNLFKFDEGTADAFQFVYDLIHTHKILPEESLSVDYTRQNEAYLQDRVAMMRQWPFFWGVSRDNTDWYAEGKAEIALPPAGPAGPKSWWGGWGFSVPKYAPHKEEALDLVRWITSNENAPILARAQSWFVTPRKSILAVMGDEGLVPSMKTYIENNVPSARPFHEKPAEAQSVVDEVGALFLTKQISLAEAMKQGAEQIKALG